jgi:hypothetical protein
MTEPMTPSGPPPGPATDAGGNTTIDPTLNVKESIEAMKERQDDLRKMEGKHIREVVKLHSRYGEKLRKAETGRVDAIRLVDQGALVRSAEVQATREATLATQVTESAQAMRVQVEAAAKAAAEALIKSQEPMTEAISDLRRTQYEAAGQKTQVSESRAGGANTALWIGLAVGAAGLMLSFIAVATTILILVLKG